MRQSSDSEEGGKLLSAVVALHWAAELHQQQVFHCRTVFFKTVDVVGTLCDSVFFISSLPLPLSSCRM